MASASFGCQGNQHFTNFLWPESNLPTDLNARIGARFVAMDACSRRKRWKICSVSMKAGTGTGMPVLKRKNKINDSGDKAAVVYKKFDEWMKDSVMEIVKNLKEAPLLVQVYDEGETTTLKTEKAMEEETWPVVLEKWGKREAPLPEGVIFVEQLEDEEEGTSTKAWGIVVQGKGADCGPACYLLKTSRVGSGLDMWCTHFCLMRVKNFEESAMSQLKNCWLLQGH